MKTLQQSFVHFCLLLPFMFKAICQKTKECKHKLTNVFLTDQSEGASASGHAHNVYCPIVCNACWTYHKKSDF